MMLTAHGAGDRPAVGRLLQCGFGLHWFEQAG
jgi:hypothetical protein